MSNFYFSQIMKTMKKLTVFSLLMLISVITFAQTYQAKLGGAKKVVLVMTNSDVKVEAYDGGEVIIEASGFEKPPKRAEGLRPIYNNMQDNTGIGLSMSNEAGVLKFVRASSRKSTDYKIKVPKKINLVIEEANWQGGDFDVYGMEGEVEIKAKNADIFLDGVSGPIVAHSVSGNINVVYSSLTGDKPSAITATSGYIDITLPKNVKVDITMRSVSGEIYTDFEVLMSKNKKEEDHNHDEDHDNDHDHDDCHSCGHNWNRGAIKGKINGGGTPLNLKAISGDIYLRKAK